MGQVLEVIKFNSEHLGMIKARSFEAKEMTLCDDVQARGRLFQASGPAFTGVVGDEIMVCCGLIKLWNGVYEMWAVTTAMVTQMPLSFHRAVKYGLEQLRAVTGLWRLQTAIHIDHVVSQKWIQSLGLEYEAPMPGYGPDKETYIRYGKFYG